MTIKEKGAYIDSNIHKKDFDADRVYKYLIDIVSVMEHKKKFINSFEHKRDFIETAATDIYVRLLNPKLSKIENCLDYINVALVGISEKYKKANYTRVIDVKNFKNPDIVLDSLNNLVESQVLLHVETQRVSDFKNYVESVPKIIEEKVKQSRYGKNKLVYNNFLTSALLTFNNWLTNTVEQNIILYNNLQNKSGQLAIYYDKWVERFREINASLSPVNYGLTPSQYVYLEFFMRVIKDKIFTDISETLSSDQFSREILDAIGSYYTGEDDED